MESSSALFFLLAVSGSSRGYFNILLYRLLLSFEIFLVSIHLFIPTLTRVFVQLYLGVLCVLPRFSVRYIKKENNMICIHHCPDIHPEIVLEKYKCMLTLTLLL